MPYRYTKKNGETVTYKYKKTYQKKGRPKKYVKKTVTRRRIRDALESVPEEHYKTIYEFVLKFQQEKNEASSSEIRHNRTGRDSL